MKKISQVLMEAKEIEHIARKLRSLQGYCALGKLICAAGRGDEILDASRALTLENIVLTTIYGVSKEALYNKMFRCPRCTAVGCAQSNTLRYLIMHLNDEHFNRYTFEDIGRILRSYGF